MLTLLKSTALGNDVVGFRLAIDKALIAVEKRVPYLVCGRLVVALYVGTRTCCAATVSARFPSN